MKKIVLLALTVITLACSKGYNRPAQIAFDTRIIGTWFDNKDKEKAVNSWVFKQNRTASKTTIIDVKNKEELNFEYCYFTDSTRVVFEYIKDRYFGIDITVEFFDTTDSIKIDNEMFYNESPEKKGEEEEEEEESGE